MIKNEPHIYINVNIADDLNYRGHTFDKPILTTYYL